MNEKNNIHSLFNQMVSVIASMAILAATYSSVNALASTNGQQKEQEQNKVDIFRKVNPNISQKSYGQRFQAAGASVAGEMIKQSSSAYPLSTTDWMDYIDPNNEFKIRYPAGFVIREQNVSKLAQFTPMPAVSIFFMNPIMAKGPLAEVEPPDLSLRVYLSGANDSLRSWLASVGLSYNDASVQPYRNPSIEGLKLCLPTLIAPGCSVYIFHQGRIYQLTAISKEGEAMIETFSVKTGD